MIGLTTQLNTVLCQTSATMFEEMRQCSPAAVRASARRSLSRMLLDDGVTGGHVFDCTGFFENRAELRDPAENNTASPQGGASDFLAPEAVLETENRRVVTDQRGDRLECRGCPRHLRCQQNQGIGAYLRDSRSSAEPHDLRFEAFHSQTARINRRSVVGAADENNVVRSGELRAIEAADGASAKHNDLHRAGAYHEAPRARTGQADLVEDRISSRRCL